MRKGESAAMLTRVSNLYPTIVRAAFAQLRTFAAVCHAGQMTNPGISFVGYKFATDKGCFACKYVEEGAPVLLFVHEADGDLQFMCGEADHDFETQCIFLHASHVLEWQPDLLSLPVVEFGHMAERADAKSPWFVSPAPEYD